MKHTIALSAIAAASLVVVSGCCWSWDDSSTTKTGFYATLSTEYIESAPTKRDHFGAGEVVCVVVEGRGGKTVTVRLRDAQTNKVMYDQAFYIPHGKKRGVYYSTLENGAYVAELLVGGMLESDWKFSVYK